MLTQRQAYLLDRAVKDDPMARAVLDELIEETAADWIKAKTPADIFDLLGTFDATGRETEAMLTDADRWSPLDDNLGRIR